MPRILLTGVATLDIINHVTDYPEQDSEVRACAQQLRIGGNSCNSATVLSQLSQAPFNMQPHVLINLADDHAASQIRQQLSARGVNIDLCPTQANSTTPTSYITLNLQNGSRTIVHYRQLDELDARAFERVNPAQFDWLHFEARHCHELEKMLKHAKSSKRPISIEVEKPRDGLEQVLAYADVLLFSRPFALSQGFISAEACLQHYHRAYPQALLSCTWGEQGVWAQLGEQRLHQAAPRIDPVVDTLGAGDTFNAAFLAAWINTSELTASLRFGSRLAAAKCQQQGLNRLPIPELFDSST